MQMEFENTLQQSWSNSQQQELSDFLQRIEFDQEVVLQQQQPRLLQSNQQCNQNQNQNFFEVPSSLSPIEQCIEPEIINIVSTFDLKCNLDLKKIAQQCRNCEYNPKRFAGAIMRQLDPKTTALIFNSGKLVVLGATTIEKSKTAALKFANKIKKIGFDKVSFNDFRIVNIVGRYDTKNRINLNKLESNSYPEIQKKFYEPERFPGFICEIIQFKVTVLIFHTGRLVFTGAKKQEDINSAWKQILPILKNVFRLAAAKTQNL